MTKETGEGIAWDQKDIHWKPDVAGGAQNIVGETERNGRPLKLILHECEKQAAVDSIEKVGTIPLEKDGGYGEE